MIRLTKGAEPAVLTANKNTWRDELLDLIAKNQPIPASLYTAYNKTEVKDALRLEGYSKCMYCESKVEHITDLHIEHIKPKAKTKFPELTYEFSNLGLACPICNRNKSDTYDPVLPFINPYVDNPSNHFNVVGAFVWAKSDDSRAKLTENEIGLNRPDLLEARGERMKTIRALLDSYMNEPNATLKESIRRQILKEVENDKTYSFCCKSLVDNFI